MEQPSELLAAREAVRRAMKICREVRKAYCQDTVVEKTDRSPVTVADYAVQAAVIHSLKAAYPEWPVVGEEDSGHLTATGSSAMLDKITQSVQTVYPDLHASEICDCIDQGNHAGGESGRFWTLDPIDGTKGFIRGDQYAIALALIEDGKVILGVLGCPNMPVSDDDNMDEEDVRRGCLFFASRGGGSFMEPEDAETGTLSIRTDDRRDIRNARLCESVESGHSSHKHSAEISSILGITLPPYRIDSQCKYAAVARGSASIYLRLPTREDYREKIWDHAAGTILIEEAGGRVTDMHGHNLDFSRGRTLLNNQGVVATNGAYHHATLSAISQTIR